MNEQPILNLDGYLQSLRRLSGNKYDYWTEVFEINDEVASSFRDHVNGLNVRLLGFEPVGYREIEAFFETEFMSSLMVKDEGLIKLLVWDVMEYIQMAFRDINPEIDPIHLKDSFIASTQSEYHGDYRYLVVPVKAKALAVGVAARA
jgi:hypothetical protein